MYFPKHSIGRPMMAISATVMAALFAACSDDTCTENRTALPTAGFYATYFGETQEIAADSLQVRGLGAPSDSILSEADVRKESLQLPFRIDNDTTSYIFTEFDGAGNPGMSDTVTFIYTRVARFINHECGVGYSFQMHNIIWSGELIDSVTCPSGHIDNVSGENLRIYLKTENIDNGG